MMAATKKEETVKFALFRDDDRYKAPLFVGVNGRSYLIKRGKEVELPKSVYEVIMNAMDQTRVTEEVMENAKQVELIQG
ncbi:hypothetical protein QMP26_18695 [Enterocloster clostridioformis]|uniref:hypothetical protein n=1 Tax=Enterocloster clostridioformis TaxID=1531 RepID=UPI0025A504E6|nr:hypothetical protein [Enterocloster clostridioformis]